MLKNKSNQRRAGISLIEVLFATCIIAILILSSLSMMQRDGDLTHQTIGISVSETDLQELLYKVERELAFCHAEVPMSTLSVGLPASAGASLSLDSTLGFPNSGMLIIEPGQDIVERVAYQGLNANALLTLTRGQQCTPDASHQQGSTVMWSGLGLALLNQVNPPAGTWDGQSDVLGDDIFFRGDGVGFSYRIPVDPTGANANFVVDGDVQWGATLNSTPSIGGWHGLYFAPVRQVSEAAMNTDVNNDGDRVDTFDIGQIRRRTWDTTGVLNPPADVAFGPTFVMQEQCNWGGDLNGDGRDDPLFLWNAEEQQLFLRIYALGNAGGNAPIVRSVESMLYLRNSID